MERFKKNRLRKSEKDSGPKINKSSKIQNLAEKLEKNMQKAETTNEEGEKKDIIYEHEGNDNITNVLQNQKLTKSMKKKRKVRIFDNKK